MKRAIEWNEEVRVGIERFDDDHKRLVQMINELFAACYADRGSGIVAETLSRLIDYAGYHFKREEDLMEEHGYPDLETHRAEHKSFAERVVALQNVAGSDDVSIDLLDFLGTWLETHLLDVDKQYTAFFHERGIR